jgi:hypothetical protein
LVQTPDERTVGGGIGNPDHLGDVIRAADDRDHRSERFLVHQFGRGRHVIDHGRRIERALPVVAVQELGALLHRIHDAALEGLRGALVDHGADIGRRVHRVAGLQLFRLREHQL